MFRNIIGIVRFQQFYWKKKKKIFTVEFGLLKRATNININKKKTVDILDAKHFFFFYGYWFGALSVEYFITHVIIL